jgi:hypothetical protein
MEDDSGSKGRKAPPRGRKTRPRGRETRRRQPAAGSTDLSIRPKFSKWRSGKRDPSRAPCSWFEEKDIQLTNQQVVTAFVVRNFGAE